MVKRKQTLEEAFADVHAAWIELFEAAAQSLGLYRLVDWLADILSKE